MYSNIQAQCVYILCSHFMLIYFIIIISSKSPVIKQALKLLNTHGGEFDAAKVRGRKEEEKESGGLLLHGSMHVSFE